MSTTATFRKCELSPCSQPNRPAGVGLRTPSPWQTSQWLGDQNPDTLRGPTRKGTCSQSSYQRSKAPADLLQHPRAFNRCPSSQQTQDKRSASSKSGKYLILLLCFSAFPVTTLAGEIEMSVPARQPDHARSASEAPVPQQPEVASCLLGGLHHQESRSLRSPLPQHMNSYLVTPDVFPCFQCHYNWYDVPGSDPCASSSSWDPNHAHELLHELASFSPYQQTSEYHDLLKTPLHSIVILDSQCRHVCTCNLTSTDIVDLHACSCHMVLRAMSPHPNMHGTHDSSMAASSSACLHAPTTASPIHQAQRLDHLCRIFSHPVYTATNPDADHEHISETTFRCPALMKIAERTHPGALTMPLYQQGFTRLLSNSQASLVNTCRDTIASGLQDSLYCNHLPPFLSWPGISQIPGTKYPPERHEVTPQAQDHFAHCQLADSSVTTLNDSFAHDRLCMADLTAHTSPGNLPETLQSHHTPQTCCNDEISMQHNPACFSILGNFCSQLLQHCHGACDSCSMQSLQTSFPHAKHLRRRYSLCSALSACTARGLQYVFKACLKSMNLLNQSLVMTLNLLRCLLTFAVHSHHTLAVLTAAARLPHGNKPLTYRASNRWHVWFSALVALAAMTYGTRHHDLHKRHLLWKDPRSFVMYARLKQYKLQVRRYKHCFPILFACRRISMTIFKAMKLTCNIICDLMHRRDEGEPKCSPGFSVPKDTTPPYGRSKSPGTNVETSGLERTRHVRQQAGNSTSYSTGHTHEYCQFSYRSKRKRMQQQGRGSSRSTCAQYIRQISAFRCCRSKFKRPLQPRTDAASTTMTLIRPNGQIVMVDRMDLAQPLITNFAPKIIVAGGRTTTRSMSKSHPDGFKSTYRCTDVASFYRQSDHWARQQLLKLASIEHKVTDSVQITPEYLQACAEVRTGLPRLQNFPVPFTRKRFEDMNGPIRPDPVLHSSATELFSEYRQSWHRRCTGSVWTVASSPDGDCLYNSLQLALFGTEAGADILRLRVHLEIVAEVHRYSFDASAENNRLTMFGTYGTQPDLKEIRNLLDSSAIVGHPQSIHAVAACSAVIKRPIAVYYPRNKTQNSTSNAHCSTITNPPHVQMLTGPAIGIAWTSTMHQQAATFHPNHFVPILPYGSQGQSALPLPAPFFSMTEAEENIFNSAIQMDAEPSSQEHAMNALQQLESAAEQLPASPMTVPLRRPITTRTRKRSHAPGEAPDLPSKSRPSLSRTPASNNEAHMEARQARLDRWLMRPDLKAVSSPISEKAPKKQRTLHECYAAAQQKHIGSNMAVPGSAQATQGHEDWMKALQHQLNVCLQILYPSHS